MAICTTCPHACELADGQLGLCRARRARDGEVVSESYGRITSLAIDPIEKKPVARWRSGSTVLSLGSYGCNMRCQFCQNASIAQAGVDDTTWHETSPEKVVEMALDLHASDPRCIGIAYTYNEPLVAWEFVRDTARLAHDAGLVNALVSNGMASEEVVAELVPLIDAANIDLKCFSENDYRTLGGDLAATQRTIELLAAAPGCHLEVTTLVVPGLSDDAGQVDAMARWLAELDPTVAYHLTRFFPCHRMKLSEPTSVAVLRQLAEVAGQHLETVILGNV